MAGYGKNLSDVPSDRVEALGLGLVTDQSQIGTKLWLPNPGHFSTYAAETANPDVNWLEHIVNFPDLERMMPVEPKAILDFGCSIGNFTVAMAERYPGAQVEGCDNHTASIEYARRAYPTVGFYEWNGRSPEADRKSFYDLGVAKMSLDCTQTGDGKVIEGLGYVIRSGGTLLVSLPHPDRSKRWIQDENGNIPPGNAHIYKTPVGNYGIYTYREWRTEESWVDLIEAGGFQLAELSVPDISRELQLQHELTEGDVNPPRRLNLAFLRV